MTPHTINSKSHFQITLLSAAVLIFSISTPALGQNTGACCDWSTGTCTDGSLVEDCPASNYWAQDSTCNTVQCTSASVSTIAATTGVLSLIPVLPEAPNAQPYPAGTAINGNTIFIPQGPTRVWLNLQHGNWAPDSLSTVVITIDSETFSNSTGSPLTLPVEPCTQNSDCESTMGPTSQCALTNTPPNITGENTCRAGYYDLNHPDIINMQWAVISIRTNTIDFSYGLSSFAKPRFDFGVPEYGGTLVLDLRSGAKGRYIIDILPDPQSVLITSFGSIPFTTQPAIIEIPVPCCNPEGSCSLQYPSACESLGGTQVDQCEGDCNQNIIVDACEIANATTPDCDNNAIPDECDIAENPNVLDCNSNDILDTCEIDQDNTIDCNSNNILDSCELNNLAGDCNQTNTLDSCDIANGDSLDLDGNCVPDECDPMAAPLPQPNGVRKNRYISFIPANAGCNTAIRVKLASLYHPDPPHAILPDFSNSEGEFRWVGPTATYPEGSNLSGPIFTGAMLQCEPYFIDWSLTGLLHVYGSEILPDSIYEVQMVDDNCLDLNDPLCYTNLLEIHTGRWGDIIEPYSYNSISTQPAISDILSMVDKFLGFLDPSKTSAQLQPNVPTPTITVNIADILKGVDAWLGTSYPYTGPEPCLP